MSIAIAAAAACSDGWPSGMLVAIKGNESLSLNNESISNVKLTYLLTGLLYFNGWWWPMAGWMGAQLKNIRNVVIHFPWQSSCLEKPRICGWDRLASSEMCSRAMSTAGSQIDSEGDCDVQQ